MFIMRKQISEKTAIIAAASGVLITASLILPACTPTPNNPSDPKQPVVKANGNNENAKGNSNVNNIENIPFSDIMYGPVRRAD